MAALCINFSLQLEGISGEEKLFSVSAPPLGAASLETHQKARGRNFSAPELRVPFRDERLVTRLDVVREE